MCHYLGGGRERKHMAQPTYTETDSRCCYIEQDVLLYYMLSLFYFCVLLGYYVRRYGDKNTCCSIAIVNKHFVQHFKIVECYFYFI